MAGVGELYNGQAYIAALVGIHSALFSVEREQSHYKGPNMSNLAINMFNHAYGVGVSSKSKLFLEQRAEFMRQLVADLEAVVRKAARESSIPVVRLNGTSDIDWTIIKTDNGQNVFERFPSNYDLTFSKSETNETEALEALALGFNVAAVFAGKELPITYMDRLVVDGDAHDLRFLDVKGGAWVGLKAKGDAKRDKSGFVIQLKGA